MIDLWLPPKPAIIRPAEIRKASFLPGMFPGGVAALAPVAAYPVVEATNQGGTSSFTASSSFNVPLPASIQAGDLLLIFVSVANNPVGTLTTPSGWTQRFNTTGTNHRFACYYKVATGSEGSTVAVTNSGNVSWATCSYRISNYQSTPESGTSATGSSTTPNPPSLTPSWGSAKTLWLAAAGSPGGNSGTPTVPTNYSDQVHYSHVSSGSTVFAKVATARRALEASSEDPGTFTFAASTTWVTNTVAIRPA